MIELNNDKLYFTFSGVHPEAQLLIDLQRTLRIPDDDETYPLPPGLGSFPLRHVDDFSERVPSRWLQRGGVILPMYQSESMWIYFQSSYVDRRGQYPFAIKIAAGKVDAVSGELWSDGLRRDPQGYVVAPEQPWLDGYCVKKGVIRQFVAMPLGSGLSAEEQITGEAEYGGLQIEVFPMKREVFESRFPEHEQEDMISYQASSEFDMVMPCAAPEMGLAPGGQMKQEIVGDPYDFDDWDTEHGSRCFIHLANSMIWRSVTGEEPPQVPPTAEEYSRSGLPWFDYYDDSVTALSGSKTLAGMRSVVAMGKEKGDVLLPENQAVTPETVLEIRRKMSPHQVREGRF
jgi:hypothetical protein